MVLGIQAGLWFFFNTVNEYRFFFSGMGIIIPRVGILAVGLTKAALSGYSWKTCKACVYFCHH